MNIVFDFGNVLVEWHPSRLVQHHYGAADGRAQFPDALAHTLVNHPDWLDFDLGLINAGELAARSAQRLGLNAAGMLEFIERIPHVLPLCGPTIALMQSLMDGVHGKHRVLYLSNMPTAFADVLEARCPWIARFEAGLFSGRVKLAKPDAAIYAAAESQLGLEPSNTLFLDDSVPNVAAARLRGWGAEIIQNPQNDQSVRAALVKHGILRAA